MEEKKKSEDFIDSFYKPQQDSKKSNRGISKILKKSPKAKHRIFNIEEFSKGREVLGGLIVHGMLTSGGTDVDWLIEHRGGFVIFEFKGFHDDKITIRRGQMIAYENLHEKLNKITKCYLYFVGSDDIDFSNPDEPMWIFEMKQWKDKAIPHNTSDVYDESYIENPNRFIVYRDHMDEIKVSTIREILDRHWEEFEK